MADVNREVSIAINVIGDAKDKIAGIADSLQALTQPIKDLSKDLRTANNGIKQFATSLGTIKNSVPDLAPFSESLSKIGSKGGTDKVVALSNALSSFKDLKFPPNFQNFIDSLVKLKTIKTPPDLTDFVKSIKALAAIKGVPVKDLSSLATALNKYSKIKNLPQKRLGSFAEELSKLKDVKGIRSENLKKIADALRKFSKLDISGATKIGTLVAELNKLKDIKGIRVSNLKNIGDALRTFSSLTKVPSLDNFIVSLQKLAKLDFSNLGKVATHVNSFASSIASLSNTIPSINSGLNKTSTAATGTSKSMRTLNKSVKEVDSSYNKFMQKVERYAVYRLIADSIIGLKEAFYSGFQEIINYDQALKDLQAITSSTDGQVEQMGETIKQVASDTKFSASEVAVGMRTLGQAGFSAQESIDAMQSIANLATGTLSSMSTAVDLVSTAIRVYGADQLNAARASDVFANAVNKSKLTIDKIVTAFNYVGPVAKNAGISFEESATAMAVLANAGLKASKIGTGLRRVIAELVDPNERLAKAIALSGMSLEELSPQYNDLDTVLRNLSIVLTDSSVAFDLFGKRGAAAALTLTQDASAFKSMQEVISESGTAAEMADIQMEGLGVSFKNLRDKLSLVMVALGEAGLIAGMKSLVDILRSLVDAVTAFINSGIGKLAVQMGVMSVKILAVAKAFALMKSAMMGLKSVGFLNFLLEARVQIKGVGASSQLSSVQLYEMRQAALSAGMGLNATGVAAATASKSIKGVGAAIKVALVELGPLLALYAAIAVAIAAATVAWSAFKKHFVTGAGEATKEAFKLSEAVAGLSKSFEAYKTDISGLDYSSDKYLSRNKELRAELAKVANENGVMSASATAAMKSIDALSGEIIDGGDALEYYAQKAKEVEFEAMIDGVQSLSATFNQNTGMFKGFFGNFTSSGSEMNNLVAALKSGEMGIDEFRRRVEELVDAGDLDKYSKGVVKALRDIDLRTNEFLQSLSDKSFINVDMTVDELLRVPQVMRALAGDSGEVTAILIENFEQYAKAVKEQQEAIVSKWEESGTIFETLSNKQEGSYIDLQDSVNKLTDAEKLRIQGFENQQLSLVSAIKAEREEYDKNVIALEKIISTSKFGSEEQKQAVRDLAALDVKHEKERSELVKKANELQKKKFGDPVYVRLMKEMTAESKRQEDIQTANLETNLNKRRAMLAKAALDYEKAMERAKIDIVTEDDFSNRLAKLKSSLEDELALNKVFASKNEENLAKSVDNEFNIKENYYSKAIQAAIAYRDSVKELNPHNTAEIDKANKKIEELTKEHRASLLEDAADYYSALEDMKDDYDNLEKDLATENKLHSKNIQKQLKLEKKYKEDKEKVWDKYQDIREKQLKKLDKLEEDYRKDKLQAEKDLRDAIAGLEDSLEDKIARKKQEGMSGKQKARDNERRYYAKMREAENLLAEGIKKNDEGIIKRAAKKAEQAQNLAEGFNKQKKSIDGMTKANKLLIKSEEALAAIQGKERETKYKEDKGTVQDELKKALSDYEKAHSKIVSDFEDSQKAIRKALEEELGVREGIYTTVKQLEDARHSTAINNIKAEMTQVEALSALYSTLAPNAEQKAKTIAAPEVSTGSDQKVADKITQEYKQMGSEIQEQTKVIAENGYRVIEENGKKVYTNLTDSQRKANSLISESMQKTGTALGQMGESAKNSYGTILDAAGNVISQIKDGVDIKLNPPESVPDLRKEVPEELEVDIKIKDTIDRAKAYIDELQGSIKGIGEDGSGLKIIGPEELAKIDAVAQKLSGLFDGLNTEDPKQKLKDMLTAIEGLGPLTQKEMDIAREALQNFADTIPNVNIAESIVYEDDGSISEKISIVDDLGRKYTDLNDNIQSNPLDILPDELKEKVINHIEDIKGAMDHLEERIAKETKLEFDTSEANEKIEGLSDNFDRNKDSIEGSPITPSVDNVQLNEAVDEFHAKLESDAPPIEMNIDRDKLKEQTGDAAESVVDEVDAYLKDKKIEVPVELGGEEFQTSLTDLGVKMEDVREIVTDLNDEEVNVSFNVDAEEFDTVSEKVTKVTEEKQVITVETDVTGKDKLEEVGTIVEQLDAAEVKTVQVKVETEGLDKLKDLKKAVDDVVGKLVKVIIEVTGIEQVRAAKQAIDKIPKETHKYVYIHTVNVKGKEDGGYIEPEHYAGGGNVFRRLTTPFIGTGSGTKDDVPAMLMKGEFVLKKSAVEKYGKKFLYMLNMGLLNFDSSVSKFANGGFVNNITNAMTFPAHFDMGGMVDKAQQAAFMMGRKAQLAMNPKAPFKSDEVVYNINAPSFHQHVDSQVSKIKSNPGKARALNLMKIFSKLVPKLQSGGNVSELMAQYEEEKSIITQQYEEDIKFAKESGDEEQVYLLEMEQLQLEELAATLAITLQEIRFEYEQEMLEATQDLQDKTDEYEEAKNDAELEYREALSDLNKERADMERAYLKEKKGLERDLRKAETQLEMAKDNFASSAYITVGGADYWQRKGDKRFTYNKIKSPIYTKLNTAVIEATGEVAALKQDISDAEMMYNVEMGHLDADEKDIEFDYTNSITQADKKIDRANSVFVQNTSGLEGKAQQEESMETEKAQLESSRIQLETKHNIAVSKGETAHTVSKLELELQLELLHLRQTYDELIREEKKRLEEEAKASQPQPVNVTGQQNIGIKYWLNKGGYVGFPRGKKRWEDSVEAMLTPGEYVVNESAVEHYGVEFMEALNRREVDPEYSDFPSFLPNPKMVYTPTTINGVTYHVNAPSFHNNLAHRALGLTTDMGKTAAKRMISIFSEAVPHLAVGGDIGNASEQLIFELQNTTAEYEEKIRYAKESGEDDLAYILSNEQIELEMIAEELRYTLEELAMERDFAIAEAELEYEQEMMENKLDLEETLLDIEMEKADAKAELEEALAEAEDRKAEAEAEKKYLEDQYAAANAAYRKEYSEYSKQLSSAKHSNELGPRAASIAQQVDTFVQSATGKDTHFVSMVEMSPSSAFSSAKTAILTTPAMDTNTKNVFLNSLADLKVKFYDALDDDKDDAINSLEEPEKPEKPDTHEFEVEIKSARRAADTARDQYSNMLKLFSLETSAANEKKTTEDALDTKTYENAVSTATRTHDSGKVKAENEAALESEKIRNDAAHEYKQREEEMIHEIQILEIELAKALFDLKKEYSTADGSVSVKHWLHKGGPVGYPIGAAVGTDSVRAMLTPGEYIVSEPAVRKFGVEFFEKLNKMKFPAFRFAEGGLVPGASTMSAQTSVLSDTVVGTVNFNVGGKQYPGKFDLRTAKSLVAELKKMGMAIA